LIDEPFKYPEFAALKVADDPGGILKAEAVENHITYIWELANIIKVTFICLVFTFIQYTL